MSRGVLPNMRVARVCKFGVVAFDIFWFDQFGSFAQFMINSTWAFGYVMERYCFICIINVQVPFVRVTSNFDVLVNVR